jgi:hypothetical protein
LKSKYSNKPKSAIGRRKAKNVDKKSPANKQRTGEEIALESFVLDIHADAKCGRAAAEYNLVKAGAIEVASGHVPGHLREDNVFFEHSGWKLTELGKCASEAALREVILRDPPLEIALWDALSEARDVADNCGGCKPDDSLVLNHRRILDHLLDRVERIRAARQY